MKNTMFFCFLALSINAHAEVVTNTLPEATSAYLRGPIKVETPSEALTILSRRGTRVSTNLTLVRGTAIRTAVTNEVDVPIQTIIDPKKQLELAAEYRKQWIAEERQLGIHKEIRDKWDLLREKEKGLKKGMTTGEVVKYMDFKPIAIWIQERVSPEEISDKKVTFEDIDGKAIACKMNYSPYEKEFPIYKNPGMPYDMLWLMFDDSGKLDSWAWGF